MYGGLFEGLELGQKIEAHGETWICIKSFRDNIYLAVKPDSEMPAQVFLIRGELKLEEKKDE